MNIGKKTIYLIRHGETEYNKLGVVQGSGIDAYLNETGFAQASSFYNKYSNIPFQKIYVSNLIRTYQTIEKFVDKGIPYEKLTGLNEISWGDREGKIPNSTDNVIYSDLIEAWQKGDTHVAPNLGESPEDVVKRQAPALDHILSQTDETLILIAMHGRAMRILLAYITQTPLRNMDMFEHSNTCLYKLEYDYTTKKFEIFLANDVSHLTGIPLEEELV
ncbi:MAG: histidine phosphatase family protein [Leadbetterella sp.]